MNINDKRIPVTLLTGFLGAGKTTLLNHLIKDPEAGKIAVIMNEFGAAGLDHDLIEEATDETVLMQSGCLCCTFRGDISTTLGSLMERRTSGELSFDRVVIETTGIAEPGPIIQTLATDETITPSYYMDGVVTAADAATGPITLTTHSEAVNQIAMADIVVITKSDLVSSHDVAEFEKLVSEINNSVKTVRADHGHVPTGVLFGLEALHSSLASEKTEVSDHNHASDHSAGPQARHNHGITSTSVEIETPISASVFDFWLDTLIALNGPDILRMKGIVHVEGMEHPFVFHGVQHIFDAPVPLKSWNGEGTKSRIAVIARNMSKDDLVESLDILRMKPAEIETVTESVAPQPKEMALS